VEEDCTARGEHQIISTPDLVRLVEVDVEVPDELDTVSTGTHERSIVNLEKSGARRDDKARKVG
jgi:predicted thioesterase